MPNGIAFSLLEPRVGLKILANTAFHQLFLVQSWPQEQTRSPQSHQPDLRSFEVQCSVCFLNRENNSGVKTIVTPVENSLNNILCAPRDPVHQPSRPGVEPCSVQLDQQEGNRDRVSQPNHSV